jgi:hypothetical protein
VRRWRSFCRTAGRSLKRRRQPPIRVDQSPSPGPKRLPHSHDHRRAGPAALPPRPPASAERLRLSGWRARPPARKRLMVQKPPK